MQIGYQGLYKRGAGKNFLNSFRQHSVVKNANDQYVIGDIVFKPMATQKSIR